MYYCDFRKVKACTLLEDLGFGTTVLRVNAMFLGISNLLVCYLFSVKQEISGNYFAMNSYCNESEKLLIFIHNLCGGSLVIVLFCLF